MTKWYDLDGWARTKAKMKYEWGLVKPVFKLTFSDWVREPWNMHHFVDMFVETRRASPYFTGHIDAVAYPILVLIIILF